MNVPCGVWVVYSWDWNVIVGNLHASEIEAYRAAEQWERVKFVPFGADVTETLLKTAASASPQRVEASGARSVTPAADRAAHLNNDGRHLHSDGRPDHQELTLVDLKTVALTDIDDDTFFALVERVLDESNRRYYARRHPAGSGR